MSAETNDKLRRSVQDLEQRVSEMRAREKCPSCSRLSITALRHTVDCETNPNELTMTVHGSHGVAYGMAVSTTEELHWRLRSTRLKALEWALGQLLTSDGGYNEAHVAAGRIEAEVSRITQEQEAARIEAEKNA
jgi:hypothetical protein